MEVYKKVVIVALMFLVTCQLMANAAETSFSVCRMTKEGFKACMPSVSGQNPSSPSKECCSALSNADIQCLCFFKGSRMLAAYGIDPDLALQLPAKCNLVRPWFHC
ncbi:Protease inhibitor/seed storage/lipid transfer protein family protein [Quillaja saponaria]|uniref:Protease inhibitor/seed storage/lipid transfer protein family protein n=1 Tax=Quillaja saponaria TaxID=32244 RepID=A0AAD7QBL6_QUISA|nr:Protease inhibitor/seed storage/lipid transfer protein family protein [Quillaja saponaria]